MAFKQAIGRFLLVLIFLLSGIGKLTDPAPNQAYLNARYEANYKFYKSNLGIGLPLSVELEKDLSKYIILVMGAVMLVGAVLTLLDLKYGPCILLTQMTIITVVMHNPLLATTSSETQTELISALKNLAIMGGLMQVCCQQCQRQKLEAPEKPKKKQD